MSDQDLNQQVTTPVADDSITLAEVAIDTDSSQADSNFDPEALDATQNLIIRLTQQMEELTKKQKDLRDMLKSIFENDEQLQQAEQVVTEQQKAAKNRKTELSASSQAIDLKTKIADLSEDIKMVQESLNTHLLNYYQLTGSQTVDFPGGEEREMVIRAKLKKGGMKQ